MAFAGGADILSEKVRKALDEQRSPDEEILFCLRDPSCDQSIIALPSRLLMIKLAHGGATSFSYADITGIEIKKGGFNSVLEISTPSYQATAETPGFFAAWK